MRNLLRVSYKLEGTVEHGFGRGSKTLGFPTANMNSATSPSIRHFLASADCRDGIYIGWACIEGTDEVYKTAVSVGINPTFDDSKVRLLESHLLDYSGPDFYGKKLRVILCAFIRGSVKFQSLDELITAIQTDCDYARTNLSGEPDFAQVKSDSFLKYFMPLQESDSLFSEPIACNPSTVSTSIPSLDICFPGGFPSGWLVEVYGEHASGKSQFGFHVAAHALMAGRHVFWLDAEKTFRPDRIMEVCGSDYMERLHGCSVSDLNGLIEQLRTLRKVIPCILGISGTPLVVIDSIAAVVRQTFVSGPIRKNLLHEVALLIKDLQAATMVTNHTSSSRDLEHREPPKPILGKRWTEDVTCSIYMHKPSDGINGSMYQQPRSIQVVKNPYELNDRIPFEITKYGIRVL